MNADLTQILSQMSAYQGDPPDLLGPWSTASLPREDLQILAKMERTGSMRGYGGLGGLPRIWGPENPISSHSRLGQQEEALEQTDRIKPLTE